MSTTASSATNSEAGKSADQQQKKNKQQPAVRSNAKFEGRCDGLKGHIYDHGKSKISDQFTRTTKEINSHVGRTFKFGGDISTAIRNLEIQELEPPL
jgi:hypothetical protein